MSRNILTSLTVLDSLTNGTPRERSSSHCPVLPAERELKCDRRGYVYIFRLGLNSTQYTPEGRVKRGVGHPSSRAGFHGFEDVWLVWLRKDNTARLLFSTRGHNPKGRSPPAPAAHHPPPASTEPSSFLNTNHLILHNIVFSCASSAVIVYLRSCGPAHDS